MAARDRYPGLYPFSPEDEQVFFGRDRDLELLHRLLRLERLGVLYGKSGLGKSSLLQAGLGPVLRREGRYSPVFVRLGVRAANGHSPIENLLHRVKEAGKVWPVLDRLLPGEASLWVACKHRQMLGENKVGMVLILDQFEEFFTYTPEERLEFKTALAEVLNPALPTSLREALNGPLAEALTDEEWAAVSTPPEVKVLIAIRSDQMSLLNELTDYLPDVLQNCQELAALSEAQAREAIQEPAAKEGEFTSPPFGFESGVVPRMLDFLLDKVEQRVEPFQLQILCHHLEKKVKEGRLKQVRMQDLGDPESVINAYYEAQVGELGTEAEQEAARGLIEDGLILASERRRLTLYEGQIKRDYPRVTEALLDRLLESRLLRAEPARAGGLSYELSHDSLVGPILKARQDRALAKEKKKRQWQRYVGLLVLALLLWGGYALWQERQANVALKKKQEELELQLEQNKNRIEELSKEIANNPESKRAFYERGNAYWAMGQEDSALADFSRVLELDHTDKDARFSRGLIYLNRKDYLQAVEDYSRVVRYDSLNAFAQHNLALSLHDWVRSGESRNNYFPEALEHYNKAIALYDKEPNFFTNRGNLYLDIGEDSLALQDYKKAISINPRQVNAYNGEGLVYYQRGHIYSAIAAYTQAIRLDSTYTYALRNRAQAFADSGLYGLALNDYSHVIRQEPADPANYAGRGSLYLTGTKNYQAAVADYTRALELEATNAFYYRLRGLAYEEMGNDELAVADYSNAIRLSPQSPVFYVNLGNVYLKQKKYDLAKAEYERAIGKDSLFAAAYMGRGALLYETGEDQRAFLDYQRAYQLDSNDADNAGNLSWAFLKNGRFAEAEKAARKAIELDSGAWAQANLAHALLLQGHTQEADSLYLLLKDQTYKGFSKTFGEIMLEDLAKLEAAGITSPEFERVRRELMSE